MIHGIGTDLANVKRIEEALFRHGDRFLHRILTEEEVREYAGSAQPARFLAKRFAAKEAFSKAWGSGIGAEVGWHDISVSHDAKGRPLIVPGKRMATDMRDRALTAHLTLTDEGDHAMAFVVLETP
ncbi:MAG: holo-ACP synthase [Betaproteobacteria bacterium]|nr:holo-ACP synthase [Betaproteobacteria bacterium]